MSQSNGCVSLHESKPSIDHRFAAFRLRVGASKIHRWGIFAEEFIPKGRKVVEYTGEKISRRETKRRAEERAQIYLFTLDSYWTIDGAVDGSGAEIINHSCEPNVASRIVRDHILYYSLRDIQPGEELLVDYRFGYDEEKLPCHCGAKTCRGLMNLLQKE
ncbi:MAG: SET domain-containing protein-lysine N-methyltransferase [Acidobacteria bacterium]|nr:SET domain-containing protein-lysine N-methyltransferase [Acidobacteriota bacterium]